jgi:ribosomal protein L40E
MRQKRVVFHECHCPCGALREANASRCRKCRNRTRWLRRKHWQHQTASNRPLAPVSRANRGGDES